MSEIYLSADVEADGPIPGPNSMLSFGVAAFDLSSRTPRIPLDTFSANLQLLPAAVPDPGTMAWWAKQPEAWAAHREDLQDPADAMPKFVAWCRNLGKPVFVGYPASYDFLFLYWYTIRFAGFPSPFGFQALDLKTMAWEILRQKNPKLGFRETAKKVMPKQWFQGAPKHNHKALDDAIGQGVLFVNMALGGRT